MDNQSWLSVKSRCETICFLVLNTKYEEADRSALLLESELESVLTLLRTMNSSIPLEVISKSLIEDQGGFN